MLSPWACQQQHLHHRRSCRALRNLCSQPRPTCHRHRGSSAITFLALTRSVCQSTFAPIGPLFMMAGFFLALSFAAMTSMISTVELCVRNFVDHGYNREKSVALTGRLLLVRYSIRLMWIKLDGEGVAFPEFLKFKTTFGAMGSCFRTVHCLLDLEVWLPRGSLALRPALPTGFKATLGSVFPHSVMTSSTRGQRSWKLADGGIC